MFVFGAGHVAVPTARLAKMVGFRVCVVDDRGEFATAERFPEADDIRVDGRPVRTRQARIYLLLNKPRGYVTTRSDPEGRPTVFDNLPEGLPRLISIGRLDFNTEGLLLLTNDGGLARVLELPATGWLRRYRVRALGRVTQEALDRLHRGEVDLVSPEPRRVARAVPLLLVRARDVARVAQEAETRALVP